MTFAAQLTTEDQTLGFVKALVNHPMDGQLEIAPVPAIVFRVRDGERIIKLRNGQYSHQLFGSYVATPGKHPAEWLPISGPYPDAETALQMARSEGGPARTMRGRIQAATPILLLRCPKCYSPFRVNADHLPVEGTQTCPSCRITGPNEAFGGYR